jgi:hypothetical protein
MKDRSPISYSLEDIRRYKQGFMSKEEMHAFEKASMEDPFLADALEGYMEADVALAEEHLNNIRDRISGKEAEKEKAVVVAMPKRSFGAWRVAAMIIVIAGAGLITYKILDTKNVDKDSAPIAKVEQQKNPPVADSSLQIGTGAVGFTDTIVNKQASPAINKNQNEKKIYRVPVESNGNTTSWKDDVIVINKKQTKGNAAEEDSKKVSDALVVNRTAAAAPKITDNEIRGRILTPSNEPLANTNIRLDNTRKEVKTDDEGNFVVNSKDTVVNAVVTTGSFANSRVQLRANSTSTINLGTIQLKADPNVKLDIELIGLGTKKKINDTTSSRPEGGWMSFKEHIAKWLSNPADTSAWDNPQGEFEMEFYVDGKGFAKDVKVLNGINPVIAEQIVEAIKQGPKWTARNRKTKLLIRF